MLLFLLGVCICMHVYKYARVCKFKCACAHYIVVCMNVCVHRYVHEYVRIFVYLHVGVYMCACVCLGIRVNICVSVCFSCSDSNLIVQSEPNNRDLDLCSQSADTPGDLKTDTRGSSEVQTSSCSADPTMIRIRNCIISCECIFIFIVVYLFY